MTNTAYEATNSDVEKLIKYARINAECGEHASPEETLKLVAALQREVDIRAQNLSIKLHMAERIAGLENTLRGTEESLIAAVDQIAELESQPLCVKSNDAMREAEALCVKLPDGYKPSVIRGGQQSTSYRAIMSGYGDWLHKDAVIEAIRAAGGTVEGSE